MEGLDKIFDCPKFSESQFLASDLTKGIFEDVYCDPDYNEVRTVQVLEEKPFHVYCCWEGCYVSFEIPMDSSSYMSYESHVLKHAEAELAKTQQRATAATVHVISFECRWNNCEMMFRDCNSSLSTLYLIRKHVCEHAHHARLMALGSQYSAVLRLPACTSEERLVVPNFGSAFRCLWDMCLTQGEQFTCPIAFYAHVLSHSDGVSSASDQQATKEFPCLWAGCGSTFMSRAKLKAHLRIHCNEKRMACPTCGICFVSTTKFKHHLFRQKPDCLTKFRCNKCGRCFRNEKFFKEHTRIHTRPYTCLLCGFTSGTSSNLKRHHAFKHSDERPFSCDMCDKTYKSTSELNDHVKTHYKNCVLLLPKPKRTNKLRKYLCHLCRTAYSRGNQVTKHLEQVHRLRRPKGVKFSYEVEKDGNCYLSKAYR